MDIAVKERLVGAAVLVALVVLVVPAVLTGPHPDQAPPPKSAGETRVVEIDMGGTGMPQDKPPAPEAAPAAPAPVADSTPAAAPTPAASAPAPARAATPPTARPASPPPSQAAAASPVPAGASAGGAWAVQVAALSSHDAALRLVSDLKHKGYPAFAAEHRAGKQLLYRVRVGPEAAREQAETLAARLRKAGYKAAVVSNP